MNAFTRAALRIKPAAAVTPVDPEGIRMGNITAPEAAHSDAAMACNPLAHRVVDTGEFFRMLREDIAPLRFQPKENRDPEYLAMWRTSKLNTHIRTDEAE